MPLLLRPYSAPADASALAALRDRVRTADGPVPVPGPDDADTRADQLPFCAIAEVDGVPVGYTWSTWWTEDDGTRLYLLLGWVDPAYRGRGFGQRILAWQEEQARTHAAANPWSGPTMLGGNVAESQQQARALLLAAGYRVAFTRVQLELALPDAEPPAAARLPAGVELRPASATDHRAVFDANAEVFRDRNLGYTEDTWDGFQAEAAADYPDHDLWSLAWAGDELAGWVISGLEADGSADTPWVGVRPGWRRRGLASALLRANHRALWERGVRRTSLWTIEKNPTGSVALYEQVGYRIVTREPRYRKPI